MSTREIAILYSPFAAVLAVMFVGFTRELIREIRRAG